MAEGPRPAIVIVTWNSRGTIEACLSSIPEGSPVVVVDNGSTDGTREWLAQSGVTLLTPDRNLGFGTACNLGAARFPDRDVLLLNPDAALAPGSLERLTAALAADPSLGAVGPAIRDASGELEHSWGTDPDLLTEWRRKRGEAPVLPVEPFRADWVTGGCCLLRRSAWDRVGGFDERYFLYFEDADLCRRIRRAGFQVQVVPDAAAVHGRGASSRQIGALVERYYRASQILYYRTHHGPLQRWGLSLYLAMKFGRKARQSPHYADIVRMALGRLSPLPASR